MGNNYSLRHLPSTWLGSVTDMESEIGASRFTLSAQHPTLLASCFAALARELFNELPKVSSDQKRAWAHFINQAQTEETGLFVDPLLKHSDLANNRRDWAIHDLAIHILQPGSPGCIRFPALASAKFYK